MRRSPTRSGTTEVAALNADENFSNITADHLRALGHDVLTALEAEQANRGVPDEEVLAFATALSRALLTIDRQHFMRLHRRTPNHGGIIACTDDSNLAKRAQPIDEAMAPCEYLAGQLIRVYRGT